MVKDCVYFAIHHCFNTYISGIGQKPDFTAKFSKSFGGKLHVFIFFSYQKHWQVQKKIEATKHGVVNLELLMIVHFEEVVLQPLLSH